MGLRDSEVRNAFIESQNRVASIALIHEKLYQSKNIARINYEGYVRDLVLCIYHSYGVSPDAIGLTVNIGAIELDIDAAIPCSLIINELVSNSIKHGFKHKKTGQVAVSLGLAQEEAGAYELTVSDNGEGFPVGFALGEGRTIGLKLVGALAQQLGGKLVVGTPAVGAAFSVVFTPATMAEVQHAQ